MTLPAGYELQSEFARKHRAEGRTEGRAEGRTEGRTEGRAEGRAEAVVAVLEARGLVLTIDQRRRIEQITDLEELDRLVRRAATVGGVDALFDH